MTEQIELQRAESILITRFCQEAPQSAASRLETLSVEDAIEILDQVPQEIALEVWSALSPNMSADMVELLDDSDALAILKGIDPGRSASILTIIESERSEVLMAGMEPSFSREIRELMVYPIDTAGALMDTRILLFKGDMTADEALQILRARRLKRKVAELRIVDDDQRFRSIVKLDSLALADPNQTLDELSDRIVVVVDPNASREEIIEKLENYGLDELTVVDHDGRVLGAIRHSTLIDVLKEDVSIDIQTMVGVSKDERASSGSKFAVRKRLPWMQVNLLTAFAAAAVVGIFESTIAKFTALAVLLPVVAGQSGNDSGDGHRRNWHAGAQALAVAMRGLALREVQVRDWPKMVRKETIVGLANGVAVAIVCFLTTRRSIAVYIWSGQPGLVLVISSSMILAMVIAGIAGVLVA